MQLLQESKKTHRLVWGRGEEKREILITQFERDTISDEIKLRSTHIDFHDETISLREVNMYKLEKSETEGKIFFDSLGAVVGKHINGHTMYVKKWTQHQGKEKGWVTIKEEHGYYAIPENAEHKEWVQCDKSEIKPFVSRPFPKLRRDLISNLSI